MASSYVEMYNCLPTIEEADKRFLHRDTIFAELAPLLSKYDNRFGVCLVHAHCALESGEKMIATGNVCQPVHAATINPHYPERWLANGDPFEFTTEPTSDPPAELVKEFQSIVRDIGVLGLYFAGASISDDLRLEHTEGRKNIVEVVSKAEKGHLETAWLPGTKNPIQMVCNSYCVSDLICGHAWAHNSY